MTPIEALESYSSEHPESIETLMDWPYRRFVKAFNSWQRHKAVERIDHQEDLHIAAIYANTNWDDEKNNREQRVRQLQDFYKNLRRSIFGEAVDIEEIPDPQRDAFLRAGTRNRAMIASPELPGEEAIRRLPA